VRPVGEVSARLARRAVLWAETRTAVLAVFVVALGVWWLQALVIPLNGGRDLGTYLGAYVQLFQSHPIDLGYVLGRTPGATLVVGGLLDLAGGAFAEPVISLLYAGSIVAWFVAARTFSARVALLTAVVLLLYPGYGILFHELSSDAVFAAAFAGWALLAVRVLRAPTARGLALLGLGVGVLVLIRPGNEVLLLLVAFPLLARASWRTRLVRSAAFLIPAVLLIAGWTIHNGLRYDNYTLARGGNATVPFFRTFVTDKIVRPDNGPATRELEAAVRRDLIPKQPYRAYGVTLDDFFTKASPRMQVDLLALSDRVKGWHSNYRWLRDVGVEAVRAHPARYVRGVLGSVSGMLRLGLYRPLTSPAPAPPGGGAATVVSGLASPTEGEPIPAAHEGGVTTPDNSIYTVWTSPTEHHLVFVHPGDAQRYVALHRRMNELADNFPHRGGSPSLANRLNQSSRWFPPPIVWLVLAVVALAVRRVRGTPALWAPTVAGVLVVVLTALGLPADTHYSVPVAPAFMVLAGAALFAPRRELVPVESWHSMAARVGPALGVAVGAVAAVWTVKHYVSSVDGYLDSGVLPHDLDVFLRAAGQVLDGASPYAFQADQTYAYPPLLAFLVSPLHPLSAGAATVLWTIVALAAIAGALWLLGLRDWRCYALAGIFPFTRSAVDLGTVAPFLLLAVAIAWRWRDRFAAPAAAVGAAIALKLFLWPLAVWLALTNRMRPAVAAAVATVLLVLVPWAALGFSGLAAYSGLLRHLSRDEASSSYSVVALSVRAHLPQSVGVVLSVLAAAALLVGGFLAVRARGLSGRRRDVALLTLALAAALAASPIVWVHYFLLLLVPLVLAQPRLSLLWLVPFVYEPLGEAAWPAGDARKLGLALVVTVVLLAVPVLQAFGAWPRPLPRLLRSRQSAPEVAHESRGVETTSA
jgi:hypothetical protein